MKRRTTQLGLPLFKEPSPAARAVVGPGVPCRPAEALSSSLPPWIRFGTHDWAYPEWAETVWAGWRSQRELRWHGLSEYAAHPLLRTVLLPDGGAEGLSGARLARWAAQLPTSMVCGVQLPVEVTAPRVTREHFAGHRGVHPGSVNPHFLDPRYFEQEVLDPCVRALGEQLGPLLLTFPPLLRSAGVSPEAFAERLERFVDGLPAALPLCVELREPEYLSLGYARVLAQYDVCHVFTTWDGMPPLSEQADAVPTPPELVIRFDASGLSSRMERRSEPALFDRLHAPNLTRRDELVELLASHPGRSSYVFVGNTAEGCAPKTIEACCALLASRLGRPTEAPSPCRSSGLRPTTGWRRAPRR